MTRLSVLFCCLALLLCACQPVQRGMRDGMLVSSSNPAACVSARELPLKTAGRVVARLDGTSAVQGLPVDVWLAVYGAQDAAAPLAVVAHAELPAGWEWDHDGTPPFSEHRGIVSLGGLSFTACTYIADGTRDAFAELAGQRRDAVRWLVRRLYARAPFGREKLTLEYREVLPAGERAARVFDLPHPDAVAAFERRADAAFACVPCASGTPNEARTVQGIAVRYLGRNFLGSASSADLWQYDRP